MITLFKRPFRGGIHPKTYKSLTSDKALNKGLWPSHVYLSLQLRNGALLKSIVEVGDRVTRGQKVAVGSTGMIAPLHSSVNGMVTAITSHQTSHPSKAKCATIIIRANQDKSWGSTTATHGNFYHFSSDEIIEKVREAGVVGLGGAGFPTASKLQFARQAKVHTLVINGGECEPYLTCDDLTMREYAADIVAGVRLMLKATGAKQAIVGVEDNKPVAYEQLKSSASHDEDINVVSVPSIYPMGSERHLIKALTGQSVPLNSLSTAIGILVNNIATAKSVYHAVRFNRPLISRVITVSGKGIVKPCNVEVPIGTPVREVIEFCGGMSEETERLIFGGPMMGQVITSPHIPIDKCVGGILALTSEEVREKPQQECIRCGQCVRACPMGLMPFQMAAYSRRSDFKQTEALGVNFCLSCGACSYVCPSNIPLVHYFQHAKGSILANSLKEKKSAQAKALTEARKARLLKEAEQKKALKALKASKRKRAPKKAVSKSAVKEEETVND